MPIRISLTKYYEMLEEDGGFCTHCEEPTYCIEPDARNYLCDNCGMNKVFGIEELVISGDLDVVDKDDEE